MAAAAVMAALILVALRRPGGAAEIAMLVAATGFCAPFLFDYDLLIFAVPAVVRRVFSPRRWTERPPRTLAAGIRSDDNPLGARSPP